MTEYDDQLTHMMEHAERSASSAPTAEQRTAAWLAERVGHVTASRFADVLAITKKGVESAKRHNYRVEVLVERLTNRPSKHYVNEAMQAGIENEPLARMAYEAATGAMVEQVGFIHHPTLKWVGGSPDGRVNQNGGVEFKCPQPAEHIRILLTKDLTDYLPQIQGLMWICGRKWWHFVSYCPMMPEGLQLHIQRVQRDEDYIAELAGNVIQFLAEVETLHKELLALVAGTKSSQAVVAVFAPVGSAPFSPPSSGPMADASMPTSEIADKAQWLEDECMRLKVNKPAFLGLHTSRTFLEVAEKHYEKAKVWLEKKATG